MRWPGLVLVMMGCGGPQLEHVAAFDFGDVALGQSRTSTLQLINRGPGAAALELLISGDGFSLDEAARTLAPGESTSLSLHFTPADLGAQLGTLTLRRGDHESTVALTGHGAGPRLQVGNEVVLEPIALLDGQQFPIVAVPLVVTNVGTAGSALHLEFPDTDDPELCVGSFDGLGTCTPWSPPQAVAVGQPVTVPVEVRPMTAGARTWSVTILSREPGARVEVIRLRALVERFVPCSLRGPSEVLLDTTSVPVTLTHHGDGPCLVRSAMVESSSASSFFLAPPVSEFPLRLEPNGPLTLWVAARLDAPRTATGVLRVTPAAGNALEVWLSFKPPDLSNCLVVSPSTVDFGATKVSCASPSRSFQLTNTCSTPITLESVTLTSAAGFPPGSHRATSSSSPARRSRGRCSQRRLTRSQFPRNTGRSTRALTWAPSAWW